MRRVAADFDEAVDEQRLQKSIRNRRGDHDRRPGRGHHRDDVGRFVENGSGGQRRVNQNIPESSAPAHTITRALTYRRRSELKTSEIHPPKCDAIFVDPRLAARHFAQCQMPSHCVAHSWHSGFAHDMQTANAGRAG